MATTKTVTISSGVSFTSLLGLLFIGLKLTGVSQVATWSWLWVLSPFWLGFAIATALVALLLVGLFIMFFLGALLKF